MFIVSGNDSSNDSNDSNYSDSNNTISFAEEIVMYVMQNFYISLYNKYDQMKRDLEVKLTK